MKKLSALILSVFMVLCLSGIGVIAATGSVVSDEIVSSIDSEIASGTETEVVSADAVSSEAASYIEAEGYQNDVSVIRQIAKHNETVSPIIGTVAWTFAGVSMAGVAVIAVVALIKYRNRRR